MLPAVLQQVFGVGLAEEVERVGGGIGELAFGVTMAARGYD